MRTFILLLFSAFMCSQITLNAQNAPVKDAPAKTQVKAKTKSSKVSKTTKTVSKTNSVVKKQSSTNSTNSKTTKKKETPEERKKREMESASGG